MCVCMCVRVCVRVCSCVCFGLFSVCGDEEDEYKDEMKKEPCPKRNSLTDNKKGENFKKEKEMRY